MLVRARTDSFSSRNRSWSLVRGPDKRRSRREVPQQRERPSRDRGHGQSTSERSHVAVQLRGSALLGRPTGRPPPGPTRGDSGGGWSPFAVAVDAVTHACTCCRSPSEVAPFACTQPSASAPARMRRDFATPPGVTLGSCRRRGLPLSTFHRVRFTGVARRMTARRNTDLRGCARGCAATCAAAEGGR